MKWFWRAVRAAIALATGMTIWEYWSYDLMRFHSGENPTDDFFDFFLGEYADFFLMAYLPVMVSITVYGLLNFFAVSTPHTPLDNETRCRKCGYILRGITEPRCPECGERI